MSDKKSAVSESPETRWVREQKGRKQAEDIQAVVEAAGIETTTRVPELEKLKQKAKQGQQPTPEKVKGV